MNKYAVWGIGFLLGLTFLVSCNKQFAKLQKSGSLTEKYTAAIAYYEAEDYYRAGLLLEEIAPLLKGDSTAERAQFYHAYCQFFQRQFQLSSYQFKTFYATYNNSPLAEEAFYMYAFSLFKDAPDYNLDQSSTLTAIDALQTFINTYPDSKYAPVSTKNLQDLRERLEKKAYEKAMLYYKTNGVTIANFLAATVAIDNFERDFPDSKYLEEMSYTRLTSMYELAEVSIFKKQRERYMKAMEMFEKFRDKYPTSTYLKPAIKIYENAQKGLEKVAKIELEIEKEKKQLAADSSSTTLTKVQ